MRPMRPRLRAAALTVHITSSVGWLGAVVVFLALAIIGLTSQDAQTVRGAYLVMEPAARSVLVPLAFASLATGIVQGLGTPWGLFRHYWVLFKLLIAVFATIVLLIYMETFSVMARVAADPTADLAVVRNASPTLHSVLALLVLLVATVLAVYKPRGMTPYGRRKLQERRSHERRTQLAGVPSYPDSSGTGEDTVVEPHRASTTSTRWTLYVLLGIIGLLLLFVVLHVTGGGLGGH